MRLEEKWMQHCVASGTADWLGVIIFQQVKHVILFLVVHSYSGSHGIKYVYTILVMIDIVLSP